MLDYTMMLGLADSATGGAIEGAGWAGSALLVAHRFAAVLKEITSDLKGWMAARKELAQAQTKTLALDAATKEQWALEMAHQAQMHEQLVFAVNALADNVKNIAIRLDRDYRNDG